LLAIALKSINEAEWVILMEDFRLTASLFSLSWTSRSIKMVLQGFVVVLGSMRAPDVPEGFKDQYLTAVYKHKSRSSSQPKDRYLHIVLGREAKPRCFSSLAAIGIKTQCPLAAKGT
jgi:hypothetical protein